MIIFGTKGRDESRGIVADLCPSCQEVRAFAVIDQYEVAHVYFVGIGKGSLRGTSMRCVQCGTLCAFDEHKYREILPLTEAERSDLHALVSRTHPRLLGALGGRGQPSQPSTWRCGSCGYERAKPFRFCPQCGVHSGA